MERSIRATATVSALVTAESEEAALALFLARNDGHKYSWDIQELRDYEKSELYDWEREAIERGDT